MDRKKLMYVGGGVVGFILVLVVIILIVSAAGGKNLSHAKLENKMLGAAKSYVKDNAMILPTDEGENVTIDVNTLVSAGYMKNLSELRKNGASCAGQIIVTKNGEKYLYTPILNCGEEYTTKSLVEVVKTDNPIVFSGDGLYTEGSSLKFKGEYLDNYVMINERLWRILSIDNDGFMRLIYVDKEKLNTAVWDNRYNIELDGNVGINNYSTSRIKKTLDDLEKGNELFTESDKEKMAYKSICIGKRSKDNLELNINEECETTTNDRMLSLPYVIDFKTASIDTNCKDLESESCSNYNYLTEMNISSWTLTGSMEDSNKAFFVYENDYSLTVTSKKKAIRPIVYLSNYALYEDGDGTKANPYVMR